MIFNRELDRIEDFSLKNIVFKIMNKNKTKF